MRNSQYYVALPKFANHEAWIEYDAPVKAGVVRAYLKWGHYPETDGRLDLLAITNVYVRKEAGSAGPRMFTVPVIGFDHGAASKGGLFIEFVTESPGVYALGLGYKGVCVHRSKG